MYLTIISLRITLLAFKTVNPPDFIEVLQKIIERKPSQACQECKYLNNNYLRIQVAWES
jgi:hypothetical protein